MKIIQHSQQRPKPGHFGEAKGELKKRLQRNKLGGRIVGIETIDRMTDRQIAAKVRPTVRQTPRGLKIQYFL